MSTNAISIPKGYFDSMTTASTKSVAVKIPYLGYQISIYLCEAGKDTDLLGQELRIYTENTSKDVTEKACKDLGFPAGGHIDASAENIRTVMGWIEYQASVAFQTTDLPKAPTDPLEAAIAATQTLMEDAGPGRRYVPFDADPTKQVTLKRMPSIPPNDNPFHHDSMSMGTELVRGWVVMHPGYDAKTPEEGAQYPIHWLYLVNQRTGNRVRLNIGENF